jgi:flagellin
MTAVDAAINLMASAVNRLGIYQTQLSIREEILTQAINSNFSARSRIRDADFAKVQSEAVKLQILQQTAISSLAQSNAAPQAVLGFLQ